jgi:hypothetical protein
MKTWTIAGCLVALRFMEISAQGEIAVGIKLNPAFTVAYKSRESIYRHENFKIRNFYVRPQFGFVASYTLKKIIFDYTLFFGSKRVGLKFSDFSTARGENYDQIAYKTTIIYNKVYFGKCIREGKKRFYKMYVLGNFGIDFNGVTGESARGTINSGDWELEENFPDLPTNYTSFSAGISLKVRCKSALFGLVDLGCSYDHSFTRHPPMSISARVNETYYYGKLVPLMDYFSLDFVFYLKIRQKNGGWNTISYKDYK